MRRCSVVGVVLFGVLLVAPGALWACSICGGSLLTRQSLRNELQRAKLVLYGTLANPQLQKSAGGVPGRGTTELHIIKPVVPHPLLGKKKVVVVDRYVPVDPKNPPKSLVFFDVIDGKLVFYLGRPVQSEEILSYVEGILRLGKVDRAKALEYYYDYLDHSDPDIAFDAFLEFAKASDEDVGKAALRLKADKFRKLLLDPKTPPQRLGLYAFLLGAKKQPQDAELLRAMIERPTTRSASALDGLLCGYIQLRPEAGWQQVYRILADKQKTFNQRYAAFRVLRFYHNWKPKETRRKTLKGMAIMLADGGVADFAIEALRRWKEWESAPAVLDLWGKETHSSPIVRRAIVRYALCCPRPEARRLVKHLQKTDAELLSDIQEGLSLEKQITPAAAP